MLDKTLPGVTHIAGKKAKYVKQIVKSQITKKSRYFLSGLLLKRRSIKKAKPVKSVKKIAWFFVSNARPAKNAEKISKLFLLKCLKNSISNRAETVMNIVNKPST